MAGPPTSPSLILQLFILALCRLVHGFTVFGDPRLNDFHGAVLLKDGEQTSCEVALISNRFGYVAATCFEVDSELKAMNVSQYEVVFDNGTKSPTPGRFSVANVTINPGFDPESFANNVAVVAFNSQSVKLWGNYIDRNPAEKSGRIYSRRSITDVMTQKWGPPLGSDDRTIYSNCVDASPVYTANKDAFWVSATSVLPGIGDVCTIAPSLVYGEALDTIVAVSAIYSHSTTTIDNMCDRILKRCHFYTLLFNYNTWAAQYVPDGISLFSANNVYPGSNSTDFSMKIPSSPYKSGVKVFAGDIYARNAQHSLWADPEKASASATLSASHTRPTSSSSTGVSTSSAAETPKALPASSSSSLSKNQIIAIAVAVPVATILAVVALFFAYKRWVKHKNTISWDPSSETQAMRTVALNNNDAGAPAEHLPDYDSDILLEAARIDNEKANTVP